jgi:hypothetical protein
MATDIGPDGERLCFELLDDYDYANARHSCFVSELFPGLPPSGRKQTK